ncbi:MAG: caspase family protein [Bacteroidota bacterium]
MKKIFFILVLPTFFLFQHNVLSQTKHRTFAIVVGISKYQNVPSLLHADKDAISFYNYLLSPAGPIRDSNDIKLFINENATSYNIISAMEYLMMNSRESDRIFFYFAGHGDVENKTAMKMGYLICYSSPKTCYPAGGCIDMNYIQNFARTLNDKKDTVVIILDACRAGKLLSGGEEGKTAFSIAVNEWKGITKILSSQPGESSYEKEELGDGGAGVFTHYLVRGLKGLADYNHDNVITLKEIRRFLEDSIENETKNEIKSQNPLVCCDLNNIIANVDTLVLEDLKIGKHEKISYSSLTNKGFEPVPEDIGAEEVLIDYDKFNTFIQQKKLINYDSSSFSDSNALFIYNQLKKTKQANLIINSMRNNFISALMFNAQKSMNNWLNNANISDDSLQTIKILKELSTAMNIIDSTYYAYHHIKATYLMWTYDLPNFPEDKKEKKIRECIELEPNNPIFYFDLALYYDKKNLDSTLKFYNIALNFSPKWLGAIFNKAIVLRKLKFWDQSNTMFKRWLEIKPNDPYLFYQIGYNFLMADSCEKAIEYLDKGLDFKPYYLLSLNYKGLAFLKCNKNVEALDCFDKVLEIEPKNVNAHYNKACTFSKMREKGKMIEALHQAFNLNIKFKELARKDEDFKFYWEDSDFKTLIK